MDLDDRLSFGDTGPYEEPPPEEPPPSRSNRAFVFIAVAMGGLILLGLLALFAALRFYVPWNRERQAMAVTQTIEAATQAAAAWTPTTTATTPAQPTATSTVMPTWTPIPTATATRVVPLSQTPGTTPTATRPAAWGGTPTTPSAGLGGFGLAAIAIGLAGLVVAVRKIRAG